jgi:phage major head subunit gpT-like protein
LKKEYDVIVEEKRIASEQAKREEMEFAKRTRIAIRIQAMWRGYKVRKDLKKKGGKKSAVRRTRLIYAEEEVSWKEKVNKEVH